mgnify:CR=1 FL=1
MGRSMSPASNAIHTSSSTSGTDKTPGGRQGNAQRPCSSPKILGIFTRTRMRPDGSSLSVTIPRYSPGRESSITCHREHSKCDGNAHYDTNLFAAGSSNQWRDTCPASSIKSRRITTDDMLKVVLIFLPGRQRFSSGECRKVARIGAPDRRAWCLCLAC